MTGATGFVGQALCAQALCADFQVNAALRTPRSVASGATPIVVGAIDGNTDWSAALVDTEIVIHLAARVHVMAEQATDPLAEFRSVNVDGTLNLARQAAAAGVKRFIYISSIKVNGEGTACGQPYTAEDSPAPIDPYGISKYEAEQGLQLLVSQTGMEVVIIRPPLIYGPGVKANFQSLMKWLNKGIPLPLGAIHNQRSLVALANLVDLIITCIHHPAAANQIFLVADGDAISTTELLRKVAAALGKQPRLLPVPRLLLVCTATLLGRQAMAQRLCDNLQIDMDKTQQLLNWQPIVSVDEALQTTARHYLQSQS